MIKLYYKGNSRLAHHFLSEHTSLLKIFLIEHLKPTFSISPHLHPPLALSLLALPRLPSFLLGPTVASPSTCPPGMSVSLLHRSVSYLNRSPTSRQLHSSLTKCNLYSSSDTFPSTLITIYTKYRDFVSALNVFDKMSKEN